MKKIRNRAVSVLLLACLVICGLVVYVLRYVDDGQRWALYFAAANSGSEGHIYDRSGEMLVTLSPLGTEYSADPLTRKACYHVTGDYWGRTGTGVLTGLIDEAHGFSLLTGTTRAEDIEMSLTIDAGLCRAAYTALGEESKGAAMVMNYKTGEILCMVSLPAIDPSQAELSPGEGAYINRCISAAFIPGSVFKLVTLAAAIENIDDLYDRSFPCAGSCEVAGVEVKCAGVHGTQTVEQALANSCNCAFAELSLELGGDTLAQYAADYGFTRPQRLDSILSAAGTFEAVQEADSYLAWSGIGQHTDLVCPYTMLRFCAAVANGGELQEPTMLLGGHNGSRRLIKATTAEALGEMMDYTVDYNYSSAMDIGTLPLCAKSGTAELGDETSHAWFTGYLHSGAPLAFVVVLERGGGGLSQAGPVALSVLNTAWEYYKE